MTSIALQRRTQVKALCHEDGKTINFASVDAHLARLRGKYGRNMAAFKALQGREHPWQSTVVTAAASQRTSLSGRTALDEALVETAQAKADAKLGDPNRHKGQTLLARIRQSMRYKKEAKQQQQQQQQQGKATTEKGTVALIDESELLWHGPMTLGGQTIQVDFDTGSSDIILNKGAYKPGTTAEKTGKTFKTGYGDGTTASGQVYLDSLEIGGLKAKGAAIGLASSKFVDASEGDSGIAGMAFASLAELQQPPFFDVLLSAGVLSQPLFTFRLRDNQPTLTLGGIPDDVTGAPTYVSVDSSQGFWGTSGTINGAAVHGIQDTGTTLIVAPTAIAKALFAQLGLSTFTQSGSLYASLPSATSTPPAVTIAFGNFSRQLTPDTVTFGNDSSGKPVLSIIGADIGIDAVIFGDPWLRNVVAIFSRREQIGFVGQ